MVFRPVALLGSWRRDRGGIVTLALGVYTLIFLLWMVAGWGGETRRTAISDLAFLPSGLAAALMALRASRHVLSIRSRRAWVLLTAAFLSWWVGDVVWTYYELVLGEAPFPSIADAGYLLFYLLVLAGLITFPIAPQSRIERSKFWLDAITVLLGGWMVIWYFVLGPTAVEQDSAALLTVLSAAYPIGDLVLIFGIAAILLRTGEEGHRGTLGLLAAGTVSFLIADVAFGYLSLQESYSGGDWPDAFWMVAQLLFVAGAQYQSWQASREEVRDPDQVIEIHPLSPIPFAAVALGYVMLIVAGHSAPIYPLGGLITGAIAVTAVVVARQLMLMNENVRLLGDLRSLVRSDGLTGLATRRYFFELAYREFSRARRYNRPLAALMVDIDHFKPINDQFGHGAGDDVLRMVAAQIREGLREADLAGRYGGEEVVVLLPETPEEAAVAAAERLRRRVAQASVDTAGHRISVTISLGVASADGCADLGAMLRHADNALYRAKEAGRNCVRRYGQDNKK